jgi:hypothetical protein
MSSPRPGMFVIEIKHVLEGEDCKVRADERGTSTE